MSRSVIASTATKDRARKGDLSGLTRTQRAEATQQMARAAALLARVRSLSAEERLLFAPILDELRAMAAGRRLRPRTITSGPTPRAVVNALRDGTWQTT